jgi:hypothetical protein
MKLAPLPNDILASRTQLYSIISPSARTMHVSERVKEKKRLYRVRTDEA